MIHRFWGSEVCCGTYACMNYFRELNDTRITDYKDFEIASSVPFGICFKESPRYDRMLTPVCDPNPGINRAAAGYGYQVEQYHFQSREALICWLKKNLLEAPVILGPIDMGKLFYLPMSMIYEAVDHYVVLSWLDQRSVSILDSEGTGRIGCTYERLEKCISIGNIPEANSHLTVRRLVWSHEVSRGDIIEHSWKGAVENYNYVKNSGKNSFLQCADVVKNVSAYVWSNSLLYEISVLLQRKRLLGQLTEKACLAGILNEEKRDRLEETVEKQSIVLGKAFCQIKRGKIETSVFDELAELEDELGERMQGGAV